MTNVVQKALEEAIETRDETIDKLKGKLSDARNAIYSGIVFVNNQCQAVDGQQEIYDHLNKVHNETQ